MNRILLGIIFLVFYLQGSVALALCVTKTTMLRDGPGNRFEKKWNVPKNTPLQKLGQQGSWIRVKDVDGDIHWILASQVTSKYKCVTVKIQNTRFREGPGTKYKTVKGFSVLKYSSYKLLDKEKSWLQVEVSKTEAYWLSKDAVWMK